SIVLSTRGGPRLRVTALLAGGAAAWWQILGAHDRVAGTPKFPTDIERVLTALHPLDAAQFRRDWASLDPSQLGDAASLESAIAWLPKRLDEESWVLEAADLDALDSNAAAISASARIDG